MKDGCISKMVITETGHQAPQYKKIIDTIPVLYKGKNYKYIDNILCTWTNQDKADFTPPYLNLDQWSNTCNIKNKTVDQLARQLGNEKSLVIIVIEQRTHVFDANLQSQLLSNFAQKSKIKSLEHSKFIADKRALMII